MKRIYRTIAVLAFLAAIVYTSRSAELPDTPGPYDANTFTLSPVVAYKTTEINSTTGKIAGGLAASWAPVDNIAIEASALSYSLTGAPVVDSFDEGAINFKGFIPIGASGFAPFGLIGYTRDHENDRNLMNAGAGLSWRYKLVEAGVDGQWRNDFSSHGNEFLFRGFLGFTF